MTTTSIIYDRKKKADRHGEGTLEIRLIHGRKSYYFSTGIKVRKNQWEFDKIVRHPAADELNDRLGIILRKIMSEVNIYIKDSREIDITAIRKSLEGASSDNDIVAEWVKEQIGVLDVADGTRKHYVTLQRRLVEFSKIRGWGDVNVRNIYDFDAWLHSLRRKATNSEAAQDMRPPLLSDAAVYNYHKCFRYLLSRAMRMGYISANPYDALRGEFSHGEKENTEYLTEAEMKAIESLRPVAGTQMEVARDLFVFQMYTGLAYSDAEAFDISAYKKVNGKWRCIGERVKTGVPFVNQLLPPAVEVLKKYGMKIPQIHNADYNKCLKALGMAAGISIPLHSHLARHTFATFMLRNGVKIENLSKMLGHTNIVRTQRYAKVLAESVHEDFEKIDLLLTKKTKTIMKKMMLMLLVALGLTSCENIDFEKSSKANEKIITFHVGHFYETRATLEGDGGSMTDLWLFDYVGSELVQTIHQSSEDTDFGDPSITLSYGSHHVYFVASRGESPSLSTEQHRITWSRVKDTFWKDYSIDVNASISEDRTVLLDRVVARMRISVLDEVPANLSSVAIHVSSWNFGIDYMTGVSTDNREHDMNISVPSSYAGTSGSLVMSAYTISDEDVWNTDITMTAKSSSDEVLGHATITNAPFKRNRVTTYSGNLFNSSGGMSIGLNTEWSTEYNDTW